MGHGHILSPRAIFRMVESRNRGGFGSAQSAGTRGPPVPVDHDPLLCLGREGAEVAQTGELGTRVHLLSLHQIVAAAIH